MHCIRDQWPVPNFGLVHASLNDSKESDCPYSFGLIAIELDLRVVREGTLSNGLPQRPVPLFLFDFGDFTVSAKRFPSVSKTTVTSISSFNVQ